MQRVQEGVREQRPVADQRVPRGRGNRAQRLDDAQGKARHGGQLLQVHCRVGSVLFRRRVCKRGHDKIRHMRIAIAQLDCVVGDLAGNAARILGAVAEARRGGADLVITPELSLCGYPPEDLVLRPAFLAACERELARLASEVTGPTVLVGYPEAAERKPRNAAAVIRDGKVAAVYRKCELPNYTVFDEQRYFEPRCEPCVIDIAGVRVGVVICEDIWFPGPARMARDAGAQLI